jgi:hypothetical protein
VPALPEEVVQVRFALLALGKLAVEVVGWLIAHAVQYSKDDLKPGIERAM